MPTPGQAHHAEPIGELWCQGPELPVQAAASGCQEYQPGSIATPVGVVQPHAADGDEALRRKTASRVLAAGGSDCQRRSAEGSSKNTLFRIRRRASLVGRQGEPVEGSKDAPQFSRR